MEISEKLIGDLERLLSVKGCSGLTKWEYDFINGLSRYFRGGKYLTGRQKNTARSLIKKIFRREQETGGHFCEEFTGSCRHHSEFSTYGRLCH